MTRAICTPCLRKLYQAGGKCNASRLGSEDDRRDLLRLGLATIKRDGMSWQYTITERGRAVAEGRLVRVRKGGLKWQWQATWLRALPRAGEVRL